MPDDQTTNTSGAAGTTPAPTTPASGPDPLATSRELKQQGVDLNTVDWMAKYNGAVGAFNQKLAALTETNERLVQEKVLLQQQVTALTQQLESLKGEAGRLPDLQKQLDEATKAAKDAQALNDKQKLLFEFPNLLGGGSTGPNPFVELVMSSNLGPDQLREQLAGVSSVVKPPAATPLMQGATPPAPPASAPAGSDDAASYQRQAMEWHAKFLDSHGTDQQAAAEEAKFWDLYKKAQKPS